MHFFAVQFSSNKCWCFFLIFSWNINVMHYLQIDKGIEIVHSSYLKFSSFLTEIFQHDKTSWKIQVDFVWGSLLSIFCLGNTRVGQKLCDNESTSTTNVNKSSLISAYCSNWRQRYFQSVKLRDNCDVKELILIGIYDHCMNILIGKYWNLGLCFWGPDVEVLKVI